LRVFGVAGLERKRHVGRVAVVAIVVHSGNESISRAPEERAASGVTVPVVVEIRIPKYPDRLVDEVIAVVVLPVTDLGKSWQNIRIFVVAIIVDGRCSGIAGTCQDQLAVASAVTVSVGVQIQLLRNPFVDRSIAIVVSVIADLR
jgi:hypothetical protein